MRGVLTDAEWRELFRDRPLGQARYYLPGESQTHEPCYGRAKGCRCNLCMVGREQEQRWRLKP